MFQVGFNFIKGFTPIFFGHIVVKDNEVGIFPRSIIELITIIKII